MLFNSRPVAWTRQTGESVLTLPSGVACTRAGNDECSVLVCPSVATPVTSRPASTSPHRWFFIVSPKLVDACNAGWDHIRCLCQQFILIGCAVSNLNVTVE